MTSWAGVIGKPIAHSLSPVLHGTAYEFLGLDWEYRTIEVSADEVPDLFANLELGCKGLSVTMPCKRAIIDQVDQVEGLAKRLHSANTVVFAGGLSGAFNTDVVGIQETIRPFLQKRGTPVVLGTGATAASALAALASLEMRETWLVGRNFGGVDNAFAAAGRIGVEARTVPIAQVGAVRDVIANAPVVVSTIPPSATKEFAERLQVRSDAVLLDVTYSSTEVPLEAAFLARGAKVASPLSMLTHQGLAQVKLMTSREVPFKPIFDAVLAAA